MRHEDQFLAGIYISKLPTTRNKTKKHWIKNLDIFHVVCERERETKERGQNLIPQYFRPPRREEDFDVAERRYLELGSG